MLFNTDGKNDKINSQRTKRSEEEENVNQVDDQAKEEIDDLENVTGTDRCRLLVWRCLSHVMEGGIKYVDKPGGLMG